MCKRCLQTIESTHVHDFKFCACGAVGIDGGIDAGNRILGNISDMEDRSLYCAIVQQKRIWLPLAAIEEHFQEIGRNRRSYDMEKIEVSSPPMRDSTVDMQSIVKSTTMNTLKKCDLCFKDDFRTISPEPGVLVRICSDHMADFAGLSCNLCGHHHHHPDNAPACVEFKVLLESEQEQPLPEWAEGEPATNEVIAADDEPEDDNWFVEHAHRGQPCTSTQCVPCPGCGGVYDGYDYGGRGCSRDCAYHCYDDFDY